MNDLRKAAEMALEALVWTTGSGDFGEGGQAREGALKCLFPAIQALRQALNVDAVNMSQERVDETAKGEHEPVAFVNGYFGGHLTITCFDPTLVLPDGLALFRAPPKREWVGLDGEITGLGLVTVNSLRQKASRYKTPR